MKCVIIGGDAAGMSCASQIKRRKPDANVIVFEKGQRVSYAACGMPYYIEGLIDDVEALVAKTPREFIEKRNIDLRLEQEVIAIDVEAKKVRVRATTGAAVEEYDEAYDKLMIATGARPIKPPLQGIDLKNVFTLHSLSESRAIKAAIERDECQTVAVVGGGYIGLELAEALITQQKKVLLFEMQERVAPTYEPEVSEQILQTLAENGVQVYTKTPVNGFIGENEVTHIQTDDGPFMVDAAVLGLGVRPNAELAREAGIETGAAGAIVVDEHLQTNRPDIFAGGDCAAIKQIVSGQQVFIPLALNANRMGTYAGLNMVGMATPFHGTLGSAMLKCFDLEIARTGLGLEEAQKAGFDGLKNTITAHSKPGYYPGSKPITVISIVERATGRLLGTQLVGEDGAALRINIAATAIQNRMTVHGMIDLDLAYAPPFAPVWDPLLIAARVAAKKV